MIWDLTKESQSIYSSQSGERERIKRNRASLTELNRDKLWKLLEQSKCADCGNTDAEVLEFDHRDPSTKSGNISEMVARGYGWPTIKKEIDKCDILCANCHRRKTNRQFGYWKVARSII